MVALAILVILTISVTAYEQNSYITAGISFSKYASQVLGMQFLLNSLTKYYE